MRVVEFPEQTVVIAKDQPQYNPLPAHRTEGGIVTCCWKLEWKERIKLLFSGRLWHSILTFNHPLQPQRLRVDKPKL